MKGTLTFNLPEEEEQFKNAQRGSELLGAIQEFDNYLRGRLKHETLSKAVYEALEAARNELHSLVGDMWN